MSAKSEIARRKLGRMTLAERLLLWFSKEPAEVAAHRRADGAASHWTLDNALDTLTGSFPDLIVEIAGKRVLDYGCGDGYQAVAMARLGAAHVHGVDIQPDRIAYARQLASGAGNVSFGDRIEGKFDVVVSLNAMEHFPRPEENLGEMRDALAESGRVFVSFGPPWFAPFGHHMQFFCTVPWLNLAFSERTVFRIRSLYRDDGVMSYEPGLNRMSIAKFERLIAGCGLTTLRRRYRCIKRLDFLASIPLIRELAINQVDVLLRRS